MTALYSVFFSLINSLTYVFLLFLFLKSFSYRYKSKAQLIITLFLTSLTLFLDFLLIEIKLIHLCLLILCTLALSFAFRAKWYNHLFLSFVFIAVSAVFESLVGAGLSVIFSIDMAQSNKGVYYVIGLLLSKLIIFFFVIIMRIKRYRNLTRAVPHSLILLFLFPIATMAILILQYNFYYRIPVGSSLSLFFIICYSLLIAANFVLFYVVDSIQANTEKDIVIKAAEAVIKKQSEQYTELLEHKEELLRIRHDMKNFIIGLSSVIDEGNLSEASSILKEKYESTVNDAYLYQNEASVIYSIINAKRDTAAACSVKIDFSYREIKPFKISNVDFALILGNLIDNAIEAAEKADSENKSISVYLDMPDDTILLNIKNPVLKDIDVSDLTTTKESTWQHGFGLVGVNRLVSKYDGEIAFRSESKEFQVSVLLNNLPPN